MKRKFFRFFNLESDVEDFNIIHTNIEKDVIFRGTNIWILMFAIIIASVGLNMNSPAVIIGAMLISPLMGPINGMGYSIATYNFHLFRRALKNFLFAVGASLVASTLYFSISPISSAHSELLARTSPTIYDVIIALFGGLAGVVAISSKQKGNVIPGVAIATALMPPLCTAGFGLATGQFYYFFGALYLFIINSVFIALSSVAMSQFLKFPIRTNISDAQKKKINRWITAVILITIIPSIYFGYRLVQKERFSMNAVKFTSDVSVINGNYLLKNEVNVEKRSITLIYGGNSLLAQDKELIQERAKSHSLGNAKLSIKQGFSINELSKDETELEKLKIEINRLNMLLNEKQKQQDSIKNKSSLGKQLLLEIKPIYPQVVSCSYSETLEYGSNGKPEKTVVVVFSIKGSPINLSDKRKINEWLKKRINQKEVKTYFD